MNTIDLQQRLNKSRQGGPKFSLSRRLYYALLYEPEATIPSFHAAYQENDRKKHCDSLRARFQPIGFIGLQAGGEANKL